MLVQRPRGARLRPAPGTFTGKRVQPSFSTDLPGEHQFGFRVSQLPLEGTSSDGWGPTAYVTLKVRDRDEALSAVAHVVAIDGVRPPVDIYPGSGRKYMP